MNNYGKVIDYLCDLLDVMYEEGINVNNITLMDLADTVGIPEMIMHAYLEGKMYMEEDDE